MGAKTRIVGRTPPAIVSYGQAIRHRLQLAAWRREGERKRNQFRAYFDDPAAVGLTPKGRAERLARREGVPAGS